MRPAPDIRWLLPAATLVAAPASAATYFTVEQAQRALFPGRVLSPVSAVLTADDLAAIQKRSGVRTRGTRPAIWRSDDGGWFFVDRVLGKHEYITYALALDATGAVSGLEIMEYRETYGDQIRNPKWRAQFRGKRTGAPLKLDVDIVNLSGATLSSAHVTDGVRRLLATHALIAARTR